MLRRIATLITGALLITTALVSQAYAATEFVCTVKASGGDYSILNSWAAANQCDLTTSVVLNHGVITGTIGDGSFVKGATSLAYGTVTHATSTQICIKGITGTFVNGEVINKTDILNGTATGIDYVTATSAPDSVIAVAKIDGTWAAADTTAVTISGWTASATNYIKIYTTTTARHTGKWNTSAYILQITAAAINSVALDIKADFVRIEGLQINLINNSVSGYTGCKAMNVDSQSAGGSDIRIEKNIIKGTIAQTGSEGIGIYGNNANITGKIYNNIIYDFVNGTTANTEGIKTATGGTYYLYNNTLHTNYVGIDVAAGTVVAKNNLIKGSGDTNTYVGTFAAGTDYNATDSADAIGVGTNNRVSQTFTFVNESGDDFHLAFTDAGAKDYGTDLSATFTTDIDEDYRPIGPLGSGWDIGADECPVVATFDITATIDDVTLPAPTATFNITATLDDTAPTVAAAGVSSTLADGAYKAGQVVPVTVTFSEAVIVTGTPQLTLSTGSPVTTAVDYSSGTGTTVLTFNYTVAAGNTSADLDYAATTSLALNSGTIADTAGNAAVLTLAAPGAAGSLGANKNIVIDTTAPTAPSAATIASGSGWNTNYIADANKAAVKVSGTKSTDTTQIKIDIDDEDTFTSPKTITLSGLGTGTTYADATGIDVTTATALADGNIAIRITAYDAAGNTSTQTVLTGAATFKKDTTAPSAPVNASLTVTQNPPGIQDTISGAAGAVEGSSTVKVYKESGLTTLLGSATAAADGSFTTFNIGDNQATSDLIYVVAVDAAGNISTATSKTNDTTAPTGLANLVISSTTSTSATLTWYAASDTYFNHYEIWYGTTLADVTSRSGTASEWDNDPNDINLATATTATTTITGLSMDTNTYYFKIWAVDNAGNEQTTTYACYIKVTAPNGGEAWVVGTNQTITWKSGRTGGNVTIQYSPDGGTTWKTVVASTPDDGSHTWTIPNDASGNVKVRVLWPVLEFGGTAANKVSAAVDYQSNNKILFLDVSSDFLINEYVTVASAMFGNFTATSAADNLELDHYGQGGINAIDDKYIQIVALSDVPYIGGVGDGWSFSESALKTLE